MAPTGQTIVVHAGGDFQAALEQAQPGDEITLAAGASFVGPFTLPTKQGSGWITVRTSAVDEIRSFSTLIIQSDKLGTSIATTLRVYAAEMRERRQMRAEEKAHRLPVLISIPLVACMLPTMIGTLMLPAAVLMVRRIFPLMTGGG